MIDMKIYDKSKENSYNLIKESPKLTGYASIDKPWLKFHSEKAINASMPDMSMYDYLYEKNKNNLNEVAINYFGTEITYKEFFENINKAAKALENLGVKENDKVTISSPTIPETAYIFYALTKLGAVANMVDPRKSSKEMEEYCLEAKSNLFIVIDQAAFKAKDFEKRKIVDNVLILNASSSFPNRLKIFYNIMNLSKIINNKNILKWDDVFKNAVGDSNIAKYDSNRPVAIVHTGGTTGTPKGVMLSNYNFNSSARQCELCGLDFKFKDSWLNIMPPFIAYGLGNGFHLPLSMGMKVIIIPNFNPKKFSHYLLKYKPNHVTGVPSHYGHLLNSKILQNADLSFLKTPIVGGDGMKIELEREVNEFLINHGSRKVKKGYGLSEYSAASNVCTEVEGTNKDGSVGIPFAQTNEKIVDIDTKKELPYGKGLIGEVYIKGPNTMLGYDSNDKETKEMIDEDKWVHTGDIGYMDENGRLYIVERIKRVIIRADGFKIFSSKIENAVNLCDEVDNSVAVATPDLTEAQGELPVVYITLKKDHNLKSQEEIINELKEICRVKLAEYEQPIEFIVKSELPLTSIGKIDSFKLKQEQYEKNTLIRKRK